MAKKKPAIYKLMDAIRGLERALVEYDNDPTDHLKHDRGADCIRCNALAQLVDKLVPVARRDIPVSELKLEVQAMLSNIKELEDEPSSVGVRIHLQRQVLAMVEQVWNISRLEYRVTRPELYRPGCPGHDNACARQGHYQMATHPAEAAEIVRRDMGIDEKLDVQKAGDNAVLGRF